MFGKRLLSLLSVLAVAAACGDVTTPPLAEPALPAAALDPKAALFEAAWTDAPPAAWSELAVGVPDAEYSDSTAHVLYLRSGGAAETYLYVRNQQSWRRDRLVSRVARSSELPAPQGSSVAFSPEYPAAVALLKRFSQDVSLYHNEASVTGSYQQRYQATSQDPVGRATFYPGSRVDGETTYSVSFTKWTYSAEGGAYKSSCTTLECETVFQRLNGNLWADDILLDYRFVRDAPVYVSVSGVSAVEFNQPYTWTATASGGDGTGFLYQWYRSTDGGASWSQVGTGSSYTETPTAGQSFVLRARATSGGRSGTADHPVSVPATLENLLSAWITGTSDVRFPSTSSSGTYTWYANTNGGGIQPLTYEWDVAYPDHGSGWTRVGGNDPSLDLVLYGSDGRVDVRVTVRSASGKQSPVATYTTWVTTESECGSQRYCY
ncbi:MAG: hypothetical protein AB1941_26915 [Gemmatimonadota bacterium]